MNQIFKQFSGETRLLRIRAQSTPWWDGVDLAYFGITGDNKCAQLVNAQIKVTEDGEVIEPFASLDRKTAQLLLDDLWNCGLRPTDGAQSVGELNATQAHLKDMRKLVEHYTNAVF